MSDIRHIVLTRFAIRIQKADGVAFNPGAALSPEWLEQRFRLFERYLLPSMQAQTFPEFSWRIYVHEDFDPALADRLRSYDARIVVTSDPISPLSHDGGILATTRIDSDDAFAARAIEVVNRYAHAFADGIEPARLLRLKMGWWLQHQTQRAYLRRGWSFLSLFERQAPYRGALVRSCDDIGKDYPETTEMTPLWIRVVHGGNVRNRFDANQSMVSLAQIQRGGFPWLPMSKAPAPPSSPRVTRRPSQVPVHRSRMTPPVATLRPVRPVIVSDGPLPSVALVMRTSDRRRAERPVRENYVTRTVSRLVDQGVSTLLLHVSKLTDIAWIQQELGPELLAQVHLVTPTRDLTANETALAGLAATDLDAYDWVLMLEDDLDFCRDFLLSVRRWLQVYARPDRNVFRFFGSFTPHDKRVHAFEHVLTKLRASQAIALRREDAKDFLAWGWANHGTWRGSGPLSAKPGIAFDKFVATWALSRWPGRPGVLSWPFFVDHIGVQSSLHVTGGLIKHPGFAGRSWSYVGAMA